MIEVRRIVEENGVGVVLKDVTSEAISDAVALVLSKPREFWFSKCMAARENLHWNADSHLISEYLES
jgi:hypothetical protein